MKNRLLPLVAVVAASFVLVDSTAQNKQQQPKKEPIPHGQSAPPGPALSPQEALKKMTVPPGFHVELVAAEPDIVNPVAMTFDERGRIWITESIEYPRHSAGPGKDRVKVLESTRGDGKFDKITTLIEGLNIPSGVAVGHGGVWVANAPDILFYRFEDFANLKLAKPEVVVTGFGRSDTHELPNSLTWGPDGWLYGLNGVFNPSHVKHRGKDYKFTCAMFRIHPKTRDFEIFCEGTSNPWGIAIDGEGSFFVSACVIDHLWHLVETGYYQRQGGPYPPYTWPMGSIVKHRHQKAAYCGITWFDSDAYPPEYREKLYMGNIHGNCINSDELTRDGSTYLAKPRPDFLSANDAWFMPVVQKTGPDGCLYILDWYDRYHCYQDAGRDPAGIDRNHGRLYRVVYGEYKPAGRFDLTNEKSAKLIERLDHPNVFYRETSQRVLAERLNEGGSQPEYYGTRTDLWKLVFHANASRKARLHAMWTMFACGNQGLLNFPGDRLARDKDPVFRSWAVRAASVTLRNHGFFSATPPKTLSFFKDDPSAEVQLQVAIASTKFKYQDPLPVLLDILTRCGDDKLIPHVVWQNLHPLLEKDGDRFLAAISHVDLAKSPGLSKILPRAIDRILGNPKGDPSAVIALLEKLSKDGTATPAARLCLTALSVKIQNGEMGGQQLDIIKAKLNPFLDRFLEDKHPLRIDAVLLSATLGDANGVQLARAMFTESPSENERLRALDALLTLRKGALKQAVSEVLESAPPKMPGLRGQVLIKLSKLGDPWVAEEVLRLYPKFTPDERQKSVELLTQRPAWAKALLGEIAAKKLSKDIININQARRLLAANDVELANLVKKHWGMPRDSRSPQRERVVAEMRDLFRKTPGDARAGKAVFKKLCAQCHKIYGEGVDVGPDITSNGRSDFDQLLSNIFDPSLVIGAGYQAVTVNTRKGELISGLIVEDGPQRIVLKVQGGEKKTIARTEIEEQFTSKLSLMPEDLEKQLRPQEIVDLLSYLSLDRPPGDPKARRIPGTPR